LITDLLSAPALSVRQPWASYLVSGLKTVELRSWSTQHRGWLWIHAGKKLDLEAMDLLHLRGDDFSRGGIVGLAKLEECLVFNSEDEWLRLRGEHLSPGSYQGVCFGWRFSDAFAIRHIIACPGELRLFRVSESIVHPAVQHAASLTATYE
jgi:activating signal cointegrator 1